MNRRALVTVELTVACLSVSSPVGAQAAAQTDRIYWANSPQMFLSLVRDSHLPILVFITSENCAYCRKMKREVWSNPQIIAQVKAGFVPLKLHATRHRQLVAKLGVRAFPTTILFTPEGKIIDAAAGYLPPKELAGLLRTAYPTQVAVQPLPPVK